MRLSSHHIVVAALLSAATGLGASELGQIDVELQEGVDFRLYDFSVCLELSSCTVGNVSLVAERRDEVTNRWIPAPIYWDPIDGIGVRDGAQDDEIDFDERVRVEFSEPIVLDGVWLSDLFNTEDPRYGSSGTDQIPGVPEDTEIAAMSIFREGQRLGAFSTVATDRLPWAPFNQEVSANLIEDGEMRRRVVINEETVTLVVPEERINTRLPEVLELGGIEDDRRGLFEGVETEEIDLGNILQQFQNAPLFVEGTRNFQVVRDWANSATLTQQIRETAETKRSSIDVSNGEIRWDLSEPVLIDSIIFVAPFDASNDFSVAGILLADGER